MRRAVLVFTFTSLGFHGEIHLISTFHDGLMEAFDGSGNDTNKAGRRKDREFRGHDAEFRLLAPE